MFRNFRKFENQCKKHPVEEKCRLVLIWCTKMMKAWEKEIFMKSEEHLNSADGKQEVGMYRQCLKYSKPMMKLLKKN